MPLDARAFQAAYNDEEDKLAAKGFRVVPVGGTEEWLRFVHFRQGNVNLSFVPSSAVAQHNSLTLAARDATGKTVAVIALRSYGWVDDFRRLLASDRYRLGPAEALTSRSKFVLPEDFPLPPGHYAQIGGLKVDEDATGQRIGMHLDRMARYATARVFHADHIVAMRMAGKNMPTDYYGAARTALAWKDLEVVGKVLDIDLTHISRAELLRSIDGQKYVETYC